MPVFIMQYRIVLCKRLHTGGSRPKVKLPLPTEVMEKTKTQEEQELDKAWKLKVIKESKVTKLDWEGWKMMARTKAKMLEKA